MFGTVRNFIRIDVNRMLDEKGFEELEKIKKWLNYQNNQPAALKHVKENLISIFRLEKERSNDDSYFMVQDNFLQVKYFDEPDGSDNVFCSQEFLCIALSVEQIYIEEATCGTEKD